MPFDPSTLAGSFTGEIILPGDAAYTSAANTYGGPGAPAAVLQPRTPHEVAAALAAARSQGLQVTVRGGGHNTAGVSTNRGGVVISLRNLNAVEVLDAASGAVRIGAGAVWGDVAAVLGQHGLAISSGDTRTVGVAGLTLGGGIGWMVRKFGLALDHLTGVELVTAEGQFVRANKDENPALFWGVRGAGANFGIITSFDFVAKPVGKVTFATISYPLDNVPGLLRAWREAVRTSTEDLTTSLTLMPAFAPGMQPAGMILACYAGPAAKAEPHLAPLRSLGTPTAVDIKEVEYADVLEEAHPPEGMVITVRNAFFKSLSDEVVDAIATMHSLPGMRVFQLRHMSGAVQRMPHGETAYSLRDSEIMMFVGSFFPGDTPPAEVTAQMKSWEPLAALGQGSYMNFLHTATAEDVASIYPPQTLQRLSRLKQQYDPENIFSSNYNIPPSG